jgi:hypothetical protein
MKIKSTEVEPGIFVGLTKHKTIHEDKHTADPFETYFTRPEARLKEDGTWASHISVLNMNGLKTEKDLETTSSEWTLSEENGTFSTSQEALKNSFTDVKSFFSDKEKEAQRQINPEKFLLEQDEQNSNFMEKNIFVTTDRMFPDHEIGQDVQGAVLVTPNGFFAHTSVDEYGIPSSYERFSTDATKMNSFIDENEGYALDTPFEKIPYETGQKRTSFEEMDTNMQAANGNLVTYALQSNIGLVDSVRDGLALKTTSLEDPLTRAVLKERVHQDLDIMQTTNPLVETIGGLQVLLKNRTSTHGLDVSEDLVKLAAIDNTHNFDKKSWHQETTSIFGIVKEAEKMGLNMSKIHAQTAQLGLRALTPDMDLIQEKTKAKPKKKKEKEL